MQVCPQILRVAAVQAGEWHDLAGQFRPVGKDDVSVATGSDGPLITREGCESAWVVVPFRVRDDLFPDQAAKTRIDPIVSMA